MQDIKELIENLRLKVQPTEALPDHDCADGYVRGEDGEWRPCPRCYLHRKAEEEARRLRARFQEAGIAPHYLDMDWEMIEAVEPFPRLWRVAQRIRELVESGESFGFLGPTGSGKTLALTLMAKAAVQAGITTRVYNLGRLAIRVASNWRKTNPEFTEEDAIELLAQPRLLLLDDLGAGDHENRSLEKRILYYALEERAQKGWPTGFTSNLSSNDPKLRELAAYLGARTLERLKPLRVIFFNHGRNFRDRKVPSVWDREYAKGGEARG